MRRWTLLVALAGLAVLVAAGTVVLWSRATPPSPITREGYKQVKWWMSENDVVAVLGPPGDYRTGYTEYNPVECVLWPGDSNVLRRTWGRFDREWESDTACISVTFDRKGRAVGAEFCPQHKPTHLEMFLRRVNRLWKSWFP
jgi:hypothetical protein